MLGSLGRVGGRGGSGSGPAFGARLIQPGAIAGGGIVTFSRAQAAGVRSTAIAADGVTLQEFSADVPRFNNTARRLLLEGQRTNSVPNSRGEGASTGTPGTLPSGWTITSGTLNSVVATGTTNGVPWVELNLGVTGAGTLLLQFASGIVNNSGLNFATSIFGAFVGAIPAEVSAYGFRVPNTAVTNVNITLPTDGVPVRREGAFVGSNTTATVFQFRAATTATTNFNIRLGFPQIESSASFASSNILPPIGTPGASTRGQDNFTSSFATLFPTGVGTVLSSIMLPQSAPSSADQILFDINDGTANNRIRLRNVAGGNTLLAGRVIGGTSADATTIGSMSPGVLFRVGLTFDGTTLVANFNGGANQTVAGLPSVLTTLRVGNNAAGTAPVFGEVGYFDTLPYVIPAANLPAAVAAIP